MDGLAVRPVVAAAWPGNIVIDIFVSKEKSSLHFRICMETRISQVLRAFLSAQGLGRSRKSLQVTSTTNLSQQNHDRLLLVGPRPTRTPPPPRQLSKHHELQTSSQAALSPPLNRREHQRHPQLQIRILRGCPQDGSRAFSPLLSSPAAPSLAASVLGTQELSVSPADH